MPEYKKCNYTAEIVEIGSGLGQDGEKTLKFACLISKIPHAMAN